MSLTKNLINEHLGKLVTLGTVPVDAIEPYDAFAGRIGLTPSNCLQNEDFVNLMENIKEYGQQEPVHVYDNGTGMFTCVAGYRRTLALQMISEANNGEVIGCTAYIWGKETPNEILFQIANFTNNFRKDLTILESMNLFNQAQDIYPEMSAIAVCKLLSLSKNHGAVLKDFSELWKGICQYTENFDENVASQSEKQMYQLCSESKKYIENGLMKINTYMKLVMLTKAQQMALDDIQFSKFEVQMKLFGWVMNNKYSHLEKEQAKQMFINRLAQIGMDDIASSDSPTDTVDISDISDEVDEMIEKEVSSDVSEKEKVRIEEIMNNTSEEFDTDIKVSTITPGEKLKVAMEGLYNSMLEIEANNLYEEIPGMIEGNFVREYKEQKSEWSYVGLVNFLENLEKLLSKIRPSANKTVFDDLYREALKRDKKEAKESEKALESYSKKSIVVEQNMAKELRDLDTEFSEKSKAVKTSKDGKDPDEVRAYLKLLQDQKKQKSSEIKQKYDKILNEI